MMIFRCGAERGGAGPTNLPGASTIVASAKTIWKISCRAEYVEPELFSKLRDAGLFLVYMGIESGIEQGLKMLHKQMTVEQNLAAVQTLKEPGFDFSYGFMLFDPSSTFESVRENLNFLRQIVGDGSAAATFSRMLPYGGTPSGICFRVREGYEGISRNRITTSWMSVSTSIIAS